MKKHEQVGRIAMRVEGNLWVAYFAQMGTMEGAIFLGSIQIAFVQNPNRKRAFMTRMQEAVGELLAEDPGAEPHWLEPIPAPESERGGNA